MKKTLFLLIIGLSLKFTISAQKFAIESNFYTADSASGFDFHFIGQAVFDDSLKIYYSVKSNDSLSQILFSDSVDFTANPVVYPSSFNYNAVDSSMQIELGNYPTKDIILELRSTFLGETKERICINVLSIETIIEDEE